MTERGVSYRVGSRGKGDVASEAGKAELVAGDGQEIAVVASSGAAPAHPRDARGRRGYHRQREGVAAEAVGVEGEAPGAAGGGGHLQTARELAVGVQRMHRALRGRPDAPRNGGGGDQEAPCGPEVAALQRDKRAPTAQRGGTARGAARQAADVRRTPKRAEHKGLGSGCGLVDHRDSQGPVAAGGARHHQLTHELCGRRGQQRTRWGGSYGVGGRREGDGVLRHGPSVEVGAQDRDLILRLAAQT